MDTIIDARKQLLIDGIKGTNCPCCGQYVKLYIRKLNSGMSLFLIGLYRLNKRHCYDQFSNKEIMSEMEINTASLDYSILKHFKLIEEPNVDSEEKRKSGIWMITKLGKEFVEGAKKVPSHVHIYNNKVKGFSITYTTIIEALGKKFNYQELMNEK